MEELSGRSWKTTLIGAVGAVVKVLATLYQTGTVDPSTLASAAFMALFGYFAKDWNVTGGK
jgi:hypothetical protein